MNKHNINISFDKIVRRFVAKLLIIRYCLKDILTLLRLDYRDASLIMYNIVICCPRNQCFKSQIYTIIMLYKKKSNKVKNQQDLNGRTDIMVTIIELLRFFSHTLSLYVS